MGGEAALVVREGWRAVVRRVDAAPTHAWIESRVQGRDLASALDRAGPSFDFAAWLAAAVEGRWLQEVVLARPG